MKLTQKAFWGIIILAIALFVPPSLFGADMRERSCKVKFFVGQVKVRHGGSSEWRDVKMNMKLRSKDAVRTFVESLIEIETEEGTIIKLEENTTMELTKVFENRRTKSDETKVSVMSGKLWANVKKIKDSRSEFMFETPTATAAIRGTELALEVDKNGTAVKVYEGVVHVAPAGGGKGAPIGANQMTFVKKGQKSIVAQKLVEPSSDKDKSKKEKAKDDTTKTDTSAVDTSKAGQTDSTGQADTTQTADTAKTDSVQVPDSSAQTGTDTSGQTNADTTVRDTMQQSEVDTTKETALGDETKSASVGFTVVTKASLVLTVSGPADGDIFIINGKISVSGNTTPGATVTVRGKPAQVSQSGSFGLELDAPATPGDYSIDIEAALDDELKSASVSIAVQKPLENMTLIINNPGEGAKVKETKIPVSGITLPGAEVSVGGNSATVLNDGSFKADFYIPDENGDYDIVIEAEKEGTGPIPVTRTVTYEKPKVILTLTVNSPKNGDLIRSSLIAVSGQTNGKEVTVNDVAVSVINGTFKSNIQVSEHSNWDLSSIVVVASNDDDEMTSEIEVQIDKTSPAINTTVPIIKAFLPTGSASTTSKVGISILDNTPDDEIIFTTVIDGNTQENNYSGNDKLTFDLEEGYHEYKFYAKDISGNMSNVESWKGTYLSKRPSIVVRNPVLGAISLVLPPNHPKRDVSDAFTPQFTISFEVKDLPNDDYNLIREVQVKNSAAGFDVKENNFNDVRFEYDVDLARNTKNVVSIIIRDKADNVLQKDIEITTR